jgi:glycerate-2-kinase
LTEVDLDNNEEHYRMVADRLISRLRKLCADYGGIPICLISGGELSCPVSGSGVGGRNQEFALYCAIQLEKFSAQHQVAILSAGTDGIDGNSDAAGAVVDETTVKNGEARGMSVADFLQDNDSYHFHKPLGNLVMTGPTGTNVRDLRLLLTQPIP